MFTPQQIEQIAFGTVPFGGYSRPDVDGFLEPLTEDYITLYKENALLKSKMKVLVTKLEEYRSNEASMKDAMVNAQKTCDMMVKEAEAKCAAMLGEANNTAAENIKNADAMVAIQNARVEEARRAADAKIQEIQEQIRACLQALDRIREANAPAPITAFDYEQEEAKSVAAEEVAEPVEEPTLEEEVAEAAEEATEEPQVEEETAAAAEEELAEENQVVGATDAVANEISASLQALVGVPEETAPKPQPQHPAISDTTGKFANLKFGRNYDPTHQ